MDSPGWARVIVALVLLAVLLAMGLAYNPMAQRRRAERDDAARRHPDPAQLASLTRRGALANAALDDLMRRYALADWQAATAETVARRRADGALAPHEAESLDALEERVKAGRIIRFDPAYPTE